METIDVRYQGRSHGKAVPHTITRHVHPKARPEIAPDAPTVTGIDYLELTAHTHHEQVRADRRIGYDALFGDDQGRGEGASGGEVVRQLSITDIEDIHGQSGVSA
jgi:putative transposase